MTSIFEGDCLKVLRSMRDEFAQTCITSPPYWGLRDYGHAGQLGLEKTPEEYVSRLVDVFREVRRVLKQEGTVWLNLGDSYSASTRGAGGAGKQDTNAGTQLTDRRWAIAHGLKPKDLVGIPWRVAFALQADGWWLRSDIIWAKPNPMPESVTDRPTKAHEYLFLLAKSERYFYDAEAVLEKATDRAPGNFTSKYTTAYNGGDELHLTKANLAAISAREYRNRRTVWTVTPEPFDEAHFAVMPPELVRPCVKAGSRKGDTVLDPFAGAGTTGVVALQEGRNFVGIELNPAYVQMAERRLANVDPLLRWAEVAP
jgi:DNA modification methylase